MEYGKDTIEKIESLVKASYTVNVDGTIYSAQDLQAVRDEPKSDAIILSSLQGLADYINKELAGDKADKNYFLTVQNEREIYLESNVFGKGRHREVLAKCSLRGDLKEYPFDTFRPQEDFIIKIQSLFEESEDKGYLLSYACAVRDDTEIQSTDDGIAQTVTAKSGISGALVKKSQTKPVVSLKPYRTFREIEQVESFYLFRVRKGSVPEFALFEADGGAWKLEAVRRIKNWLKEHIDDKDFVILA